jgi:hypothetical protein
MSKAAKVSIWIGVFLVSAVATVFGMKLVDGQFHLRSRFVSQDQTATSKSKP